MALTLDSEIEVFEDREKAGQWRVEFFDSDGGCYVTIFSGPNAELRARSYGQALRVGAIPSGLPDSH
jgi:hypothetical protein